MKSIELKMQFSYKDSHARICNFFFFKFPDFSLKRSDIFYFMVQVD